MMASRWVYRPFITLLNGSGILILRMVGAPYQTHRHIHSPDEIELLIAESRDGGLLEPDEHRRLQRALRLNLRQARWLWPAPLLPRVWSCGCSTTSATSPTSCRFWNHSLMRTWEHWQQHTPPDQPIDLENYEAVGTFRNALSRHAEEAYQEAANGPLPWLTQRIFKALTDTFSDPRGVRRPT